MTDRHIRLDGVVGAPALILSNSLGCTADMWQPQLATLGARFRLIRYEHPGHGDTRAPMGPYSIDLLGGEIIAVLDEVGIETASVMGLSLGGVVAMWLAAVHPERVDRLVIACSAPFWPPPELWSERITQVRVGGTPNLLDVLLGRWFTSGFTDGHPDVRSWVASMLDTVESEAYAACCGALSTVDLRPDLGRISAPTLVLSGASDPAVPFPAATSLAEAIPGASLQVIAPGAHLLNVEQPERYNAAVLDHLTGSPGERGRAIREAVLGAPHVERAQTALTPLTVPFSDLITRYVWGEIWTRPALDHQTRSAITLAMLVALGRFDELELHLVGARRNGLSDAQIGEVLLQTAAYCGVPAAHSAFAVAQRVLGATGDNPSGAL